MGGAARQVDSRQQAAGHLPMRGFATQRLHSRYRKPLHPAACASTAALSRHCQAQALPGKGGGGSTGHTA